MIRVSIVGASGYAGAELAGLIHKHPEFEIAGLYVSENSADAYKAFSALHGKYAYQIDRTLIPISESQIAKLVPECDAIFLCTPHEASVEMAARIVEAGGVVFDLSGAYRLSDLSVIKEYYGFSHKYPELLTQAVYGLAEWNAAEIRQANLVAVPGCYPTASLSALKPLQEAKLIDSSVIPNINAVSGASGAGRSAKLSTSFCEVSFNPYGVLSHRHTPEIAEHLSNPVIFTPHLGNFKRGILATITLKLNDGTNIQQINQAYNDAYEGKKLVRLRQSWPAIQNVEGTPFVDLHWALDEKTGYLIVVSAIDNVLKGASSQAVQCANLRFGFDSGRGLV
ncbi:N-acetyl-gamma-glutamyl-phosphate reductase [Catenovulum agarivorans DS-2]|uniref:N-acetyl-gamma-glutamyl-phosphate reductase n=1 Tax=Catenovulum agarivorans DS-2 TaxID=1328313 RepID=W7QFH5_9ALTE|nr:N-acetyl-gamma-glutamyl-phosphate reductase [Catenovulum agarivorans]EWH11659.1 N-acetyl-gamma-glutamyl-phosphate reductase [Catenovulum agarivorans DS-2]